MPAPLPAASKGPLAAGPVAQWLEPAAHNGLVAGSSPAGPTSLRSRSELLPRHRRRRSLGPQVAVRQAIIAINPNNPERFRAKWIPVRVKKTRQNKRLEHRF